VAEQNTAVIDGERSRSFASTSVTADEKRDIATISAIGGAIT
jgi:hypothetical protein